MILHERSKLLINFIKVLNGLVYYINVGSNYFNTYFYYLIDLQQISKWKKSCDIVLERSEAQINLILISII